MSRKDDAPRRDAARRDAPRPDAPRREGTGNSRFRLGHARELLAEILERPAAPADQQIGRFFADRRYLGSHDRGFISDTVYGVLRAALRLRFILGDGGKASPYREAGILIATYLLERGEQLDEGARAALGQGEGDLGAVRAALADAESRIESLPEPERSGVRYSLPAWFTGRLLEQMAPGDAGALMNSLGEQAPITLRANRLLVDRDRLASALGERGIPSTPGRWAPEALLLDRRLNANAIPEFKEGWFELQDEGSQLLSAILDPHPNWNVFDACAGAGGKSLHMAAIMRGRGSVVAHDVNARRLAEIRPRLKRSSAQNVRVMAHETYLERRPQLAGKYDAVMIDAPCSGAGVLRRNPGARLTFDEGMVERLNVLQARILDEYSALVKPGGLLLYATCSLLREENEGQVERFVAEHAGWTRQPFSAPDEMITSEGFFRCYPHLHGTDAFFGALLRRG
jgi:16S rRNA (cytosine967-C5)-methyltransferase